MEEKTIIPDAGVPNTGTPQATQEQQAGPAQFGNLILNELHRPRSIQDTAAIIQFCVNVGILPDNYGTQIISKRQAPYVPPQVQAQATPQTQEQPKAGD